jgi:hypothetical protein
VESRLLLDVVVRKSAAVLELLAGEDQALLVRGNALLVLDLGLDIVFASVSSCPRLMRSVSVVRVPIVSEDSTRLRVS